MDVPSYRLQLPATTPLTCAPDRRFDAIAALTSHLLDAPTALVSLVDRTQQVFPGAVGLPGPWQDFRFTPLSHSFCRYVVATGAPLVLDDAREVDGFADNPAIEDLGVVAYAGYPVTDHHGRTVGSLCAIDQHPRRWTETETSTLAELAQFCSNELGLRTSAVQEALVAERERIAEDLQRGVTSDLKALAMLLGGIRSVATAESQNMVDDAIDAVDQILARLHETLVHATKR